MQLAVFGAGNVGGTLGKGWARAGHSVTFGVRNPLDPKVQCLLADIGTNAEAQTIGEAAKAPVVVLCIPWQAAQETIRAAGNLQDKIVIDATNPIAMTLDGLRQGLVIGHRTSAAEQVAQWAPEAHVVKACNTTGWENMAHPVYGSQSLTMMLCGDDTQSKSVVASLVRDLRFEPVDVGPLRSARYLEAVAMLWIDMAIFQGFGTSFAFQVLKR